MLFTFSPNVILRQESWKPERKLQTYQLWKEWIIKIHPLI